MAESPLNQIRGAINTSASKVTTELGDTFRSIGQSIDITKKLSDLNHEGTQYGNYIMDLAGWGVIVTLECLNTF